MAVARPSTAPPTSSGFNQAVLGIIVVVLIVVMLGTFALTGAASGSHVAALGTMVVVGLAVIGATRLVAAAFERRVRTGARRAAAEPLLVDTGPTPAHAVLADAGHELEALGYAVDCTATTHGGLAITLLVHPDGSVASLLAHKGRAMVVVTTCLLPGERWLRTAVAANSHVGPVALVDGCGRGATAAEIVARHREVRHVLGVAGLSVLLVGRGGAAADQLERRRAMVRDVRAFAPRPGPAARTWTLLEDPALPGAVAEIRERQADVQVGAAAGTD